MESHQIRLPKLQLDTSRYYPQPLLFKPQYQAEILVVVMVNSDLKKRQRQSQSNNDGAAVHHFRLTEDGVVALGHIFAMILSIYVCIYIHTQLLLLFVLVYICSILVLLPTSTTYPKKNGHKCTLDSLGNGCHNFLDSVIQLHFIWSCHPNGFVLENAKYSTSILQLLRNFQPFSLRKQ